MALSKEKRVELDLSPLDFFFLCTLKENVYAKGEGVLNKNHTFNSLDSTNKESSKIEGNADLLNRVHANFAKKH